LKPRLACLAGLALATALPARAGPHEHGAGTLDVARDGRTLTIELRLPAKDAVGFERAPRNDAERKAIEQARMALADAKLFVPSAAAQCVAADAPVVEVPVFAATPAAGDDHADITATYRFECANVAALAGVEHGVFKAFPKIKRLDARSAAATGQKQTVLTPGKPRLAF
jgi:hypothetical protein